ncbi:MAG: TonB-dependent receptor [Gammaproteobacteria bacterium]|nr:TonB-dependent receptor [Gammaproteobacteria bacterium]
MFRTLVLLLVFISTSVLADDGTNPTSLEEIKVTAEKRDLSIMTPKTQQLLKTAGTHGDPLVAVFSLPGVTFVSDTQSAPAVRGAAPEDNSYVIDFIPASYVFHMFGDSIFNENVIYDFDLIPAAFGNEYANATGAVIDVTLRNPKQTDFTATLDWSFLRTGVLIESALSENQAFYASYRRSLIDQFYPESEQDKLEKEEGIKVNSLPVSTDYQVKYRWMASDQHNVSVVLAGASDEVAATLKQNSNDVLRDPDLLGFAKIALGFDSQGLIWDWDSDQYHTQLKTALSHINTQYAVSYGSAQYQNTDANSTILKTELGFIINAQHQAIIGGGFDNTDYAYTLDAKIRPCGFFVADCATTDAIRYTLNDQLTINTVDLYIEDQWQITSRLSITPGLHYSQDDYLKENITEPRVRALFRMTDDWRITAAFGRYHQRPQLFEILPTIGNPELHSPKATHYVAGLEHDFSDGWSWKSEIYYKKLYDLVLSLDPATDLDAANNYSNDAAGKAYGVEFFLNKNFTEHWYGWTSLSLAKTERHNERTGETRPFDYDKPVILNIVANYQWNPNWLLGIKWSVQSGTLYTPIVDVQTNANNPAIIDPIYGEINSERLPFYHRLDIRLERNFNFPRNQLSLFVDLLNAYGQRNVDGYYLSSNGNSTESATPDGFGQNVPVSATEGIGFFPSIGVKMTF